jgi:hypothetical protein
VGHARQVSGVLALLAKHTLSGSLQEYQQQGVVELFLPDRCLGEEARGKRKVSQQQVHAVPFVLAVPPHLASKGGVVQWCFAIVGACEWEAVGNSNVTVCGCGPPGFKEVSGSW